MRNTRKKQKVMAEINITPFTDVILVLLIIFMVATPILFQNSIRVSLPRAGKSDETPKNIAIVITEKGEIFIDKELFVLPDDADRMKMKLLSLIMGNQNASVVINGDRNVRYEFVVRAMDIAKQLGVKHVLLGIELEKPK